MKINVISDLTDDLIKVMKDFDKIYHIKNRTKRICSTAVKQRGWALQFVEKQIPEICLEAVRQDKSALKYVRDSKLKTQIKKKLNI